MWRPWFETGYYILGSRLGGWECLQMVLCGGEINVVVDNLKTNSKTQRLFAGRLARDFGYRSSELKQ